MTVSSLSRRIAGLTTVGISIVLLLGVLVTAAVLREESGEQRDEVMHEFAPFAAAVLSELVVHPERLDGLPDESVVSRLQAHEPFFGIGVIAADGSVLLEWDLPETLPDPRKVGETRESW